MSTDLILIKAYGRAAEAKLKGLMRLNPAQIEHLPFKSIRKINRIAAELIEGYEPAEA